MAGSVGDIYQIRLYQTYRGQQLVLAHYYEATSGTPSAEDLAAEFNAGLFQDIRAMQHADCVTTRYTVVNGMDNDDQDEQFPNAGGANAGTAQLPATIAATFRSSRSGLGYRYSYRHVGGLVNLIGTSGDWNTSMNTLQETLAVAFGAVVESAAASYTPVQITGGFVFGTVPLRHQYVAGNWVYNDVAGSMATRREYAWLTPTP